MRASFAAILWLMAFPASAQVVLTAANGTQFTVQDRSGGQLTAPAAFAGWPGLCVRVCQDCEGACEAADTYDAGGQASAEELNGRQRALTAVNRAGLQVRRKVFVPGAGPAQANGFVRYLDLLTNPGAAPVTVSVRIGSTGAGIGRLGSAAQTAVRRTGDDDAEVEVSDRWVVTDDNDAFGGAGALGHLLQGAGARVTPSRVSLRFADPNDVAAFAWEFREVTVNAGATVAFLTVVTHEADRGEAVAEVGNLLGMPTDVLFGLTDDERRAILNFDVDPGNAAPVADAGGPYNAPEGQQVALTAVGSVDPDAQPMQYLWDLDADGEFDDAAGANALATFRDNGVYEVRVRVTDAGGKTDVDAARVVVVNVAPRIDGVITDSPIEEGSELQVEVQAVEPGADQVAFDFDWDGDGTFEEVGVQVARWQHRYLADGDYTAAVRAHDDDGGSSVRQFEVVVRNGAPQVFDIISNTPAPEGALVTINVVAQDPGDDPMNFEYDLDDDGVFERAGVGLEQVETRFPGDGLYTIRVRVTDDAGLRVTREEDLSILNARPAIVAVRDTGPVEEGSVIRIEVVANDPGNDPLRYSFDLDNDGDFADDVSDAEENFVEHTFMQQGLKTVGVRVRDDAGLFAVAVAEVEIVNGPPTGSIEAPEFVDEGQVFQVRVTAQDPGADALLYDWDLDGDGAFDIINSRDAVRDVSLAQEGVFTLRVRVRDDVGAAASLEARVVVRNVAPTATVEVESPGDEGTEIAVRVEAQDPGGDELRYSYDFDGDGVFELEGLDRDEINAVYADQGMYTLVVLVDDGTDTATVEAPVEVRNVAPRITLRVNSPVAEGEDLVFRATVDERGDDVVTLLWDTDGDGEADIQSNAELEQTVRAPDDARFLATLTARDEDGGESVAEAQVIITNVAPTIVDIAEAPPAVEGTPYGLIMVADDPALANDRITWSLIDPPPGVEIDPQAGRFVWTPTYQDALSSPLTLRVRADDGDGGRDTSELRVMVLPLDEDGDGLPDTYERRTCNAQGVCLDPTDPNDATSDIDGDGRDNATEFRDGTDPFTYEGPSTPEALAPDDGERVRTLEPMLTVTNVGGGDQVSLVFELYESLEALQAGTAFVTSDPVPQAAGEAPTVWQPAAGLLLEDTWYWWRARATTPTAHSEWSLPRSFRTNATNQQPTTPVLRSPEDGAVVSELQPALEALPSEDPDGDELVYTFNLFRLDENGTATPESSERGTLTEDVVRFVPRAVLIENVVYAWEVVARDEQGEASAPSERRTFTVNTSNQEPSTPQIRFPTNEATVTELRPTFIAGGSVDLDSPTVQYVFTLRDEAGQETAKSEPLAPDGDEAGWQPEAGLAENARYTLEVFATDGEVNSDVASATFFVSATEEPPPAPALIAPADGADVDADVALVWTQVDDPERTKVSYEASFCIEGGTTCGKTPRSSSRNAIPEGLEAGATYTWYVVAYDEKGTASGHSATRRFSVKGGGGGGGGGCRAVDGAAAPWAFALVAAGLVVVRRRRRA